MGTIGTRFELDCHGGGSLVACCLWLLLLLRWLKPSVLVGSHTRMYGKKVTQELVESKICIQPQLRQSCIQEILSFRRPSTSPTKNEIHKKTDDVHSGSMLD